MAGDNVDQNVRMKMPTKHRRLKKKVRLLALYLFFVLSNRLSWEVRLVSQFKEPKMETGIGVQISAESFLRSLQNICP